DVLHGRGPEDLRELTFVLGAEMIRLAGLAKDEKSARAKMDEAVRSGAAAAKMKQIIAAQGGDAAVVDDLGRLPKAPIVRAVKATKTGFVHHIDAMEIGLTGVAMGAGRTRADQDVDPAVGIVLLARRGDRVNEGDPIAE